VIRHDRPEPVGCDRVDTICRVTSLRRLTVLFVIALFVLSACGGSDDKDETSKGSSASKGECTYPEDTSGPPARKVDPPPADPITKKATRATITTNRGVIPVTLDGDVTPCTVSSFLSLAKQGYFDKTPCHRLVDQGIFVLQCGDPSGSGQGGPGYFVEDELPQPDPRLTGCQDQGGAKVCIYPPGTLAMGKGGDASGLPIPDTAGSQFFLVYDNSPLPEGYTVFGRMTASGLAVVKKVAAGGAQPADANGNTAPKLPTTITSVK
jgi:peptidyl-prolyl cis-trans isomerase B (cyclophilin B)